MSPVVAPLLVLGPTQPIRPAPPCLVTENCGSVTTHGKVRQRQSLPHPVTAAWRCNAGRGVLMLPRFSVTGAGGPLSIHPCTPLSQHNNFRNRTPPVFIAIPPARPSPRPIASESTLQPAEPFPPCNSKCEVISPTPPSRTRSQSQSAHSVRSVLRGCQALRNYRPLRPFSLTASPHPTPRNHWRGDLGKGTHTSPPSAVVHQLS